MHPGTEEDQRRGLRRRTNGARPRKGAKRRVTRIQWPVTGKQTPLAAAEASGSAVILSPARRDEGSPALGRKSITFQFPGVEAVLPLCAMHHALCLTLSSIQESGASDEGPFHPSSCIFPGLRMFLGSRSFLILRMISMATSSCSRPM